MSLPPPADRIILVGVRDAEERDDSIADKFLDDAVIACDNLSDLSEDLVHDTFDFFGVELLRHGGVARKVGEEDGDVLALGRGRGRRLRRRGGWLGKELAAFAAEFLTQGYSGFAVRAFQFHPRPALLAELHVLTIIGLAFWALHFRPP